MVVVFARIEISYIVGKDVVNEEKLTNAELE